MTDNHNLFPSDSNDRPQLQFLPGGIIDGTFVNESPTETEMQHVREQLDAQSPIVLLREAANTVVGSIEGQLLQTARAEKPTPASRRLVHAINRKGAELLIELINSGNTMPAEPYLAPFASKLRAVDADLFPAMEQYVEPSSGRTDDLVRTLTQHARALDASSEDMVQAHRQSMEDGALAIWGIVGLIATEEGGLALNSQATPLLADIQRHYSEAMHLKPLH